MRLFIIPPGSDIVSLSSRTSKLKRKISPKIKYRRSPSSGDSLLAGAGIRRKEFRGGEKRKIQGRKTSDVRNSWTRGSKFLRVVSIFSLCATFVEYMSTLCVRACVCVHPLCFYPSYHQAAQENVLKGLFPRPEASCVPRLPVSLLSVSITRSREKNLPSDGKLNFVFNGNDKVSIRKNELF